MSDEILRNDLRTKTLWSSKDDLNISQMRALKLSLNRRFLLIQGPPGNCRPVPERSSSLADAWYKFIFSFQGLEKVKLVHILPTLLQCATVKGNGMNVCCIVPQQTKQLMLF